VALLLLLLRQLAPLAATIHHAAKRCC